jgi:hypothetical protein
MAAVFMYGGMQKVLEGTTGEITSIRPAVLRLFTNDVIPNVEDDSRSYDECSLSGYSPVAFADMEWTTKRLGGVVRKIAPLLVYTFPSYAGPLVTIFGSYATLDGSFPDMLYGDRFDPPFVVPLIGGKIQVAPSLSLRKLVVP